MFSPGELEMFFFSMVTMSIFPTTKSATHLNWENVIELTIKHFICLKISQTQRSLYFKLLTPHIFYALHSRKGTSFYAMITSKSSIVHTDHKWVFKNSQTNNQDYCFTKVCNRYVKNCLIVRKTLFNLCEDSTPPKMSLFSKIFDQYY